MCVNKITLSSQAQSSQLEIQLSTPQQIKAVVNNISNNVSQFGHAPSAILKASDDILNLPNVTVAQHNDVIAEDQCEIILLL